MIIDERIRNLNGMKTADRPYVIYWMQSSQRSEWNHALEYAIDRANGLKKPIIVYFGLTDSFPEANERHYAFMLEGLRDVKSELHKRGIRMVIRRISPDKGAMELSSLAALMVVDRGYLRIERQWRSDVADSATCPVIQVETDVIVPVEMASPKEEYSAATLRRKIGRLIHLCELPLAERECVVTSVGMGLDFDEYDISDVGAALSGLDIDTSVGRVDWLKGGTGCARAELEDFIENRLERYGELRNEPGLSYSSNMSPYLHFGQISPLYILMRLRDVDHSVKKEFIEELVVRRELSMNFAFYNDRYDSFDSAPSWAKETLRKHLEDPREHIYSLGELEKGATHDPYWNAAQMEMVRSGKMHGYMRMYWAKKILEWSPAPEIAFSHAIHLNNRYSIDGRDPNGFAGVAWCFGKHDRPWAERSVFGTVRYMNDKGLKRKFDMDAYLKRVDLLDCKSKQDADKAILEEGTIWTSRR